MRNLSLLSILAVALQASSQDGTPKKPVSIPIVIDIHIQITITVTVPDVVPPIPKPPTPPTPIPPTPIPPIPPTPIPDAFVTRLKDAAEMDGFNRTKFSALSTGFEECALETKPGIKAGVLQQTLAKVLREAIPEGIPVNTRAVLATQLKPINALLPASAPDAVVTDSDSAAIVEIFTKLSKACSAAAK